MSDTIRSGSTVRVNYYKTDGDLYCRKPFKSEEYGRTGINSLILKCLCGFDGYGAGAVDAVREDGLVLCELIKGEYGIEMYRTREAGGEYRKVYDCLMDVVASYLYGRVREVMVFSIDFMESKEEDEIGVFSFSLYRVGSICFGITSDLKIRDRRSSMGFLEE